MNLQAWHTVVKRICELSFQQLQDLEIQYLFSEWQITWYGFQVFGVLINSLLIFVVFVLLLCDNYSGLWKSRSSAGDLLSTRPDSFQCLSLCFSPHSFPLVVKSRHDVLAISFRWALLELSTRPLCIIGAFAWLFLGTYLYNASCFIIS